MSDYPTIPAPIRALMQRPPVLKGELVQKYNDLLAGLVSQVEPGDIIEWLWVLSFLDHAWDVLRIRQFKVVLIDLQHLKALSAVVMKTEPFYEYSNKGLAQETMNWWADPTNFAKKHIDPLSVPATAAVQIRESSDALDRRLERAERRCDTIMQQLEYRREVFANRARRAADSILNAPTAQIPSLELPDAGAPMAPLDQMAPDQIAADDIATAPTSPTAEAGEPRSQDTSAENSQSKSLELADQTKLHQIPADQVAIEPISYAAEAGVPSFEETSAEMGPADQTTPALKTADARSRRHRLKSASMRRAQRRHPAMFWMRSMRPKGKEAPRRVIISAPHCGQQTQCRFQHRTAYGLRQATGQPQCHEARSVSKYRVPAGCRQRDRDLGAGDYRC